VIRTACAGTLLLSFCLLEKDLVQGLFAESDDLFRKMCRNAIVFKVVIALPIELLSVTTENCCGGGYRAHPSEACVPIPGVCMAAASKVFSIQAYIRDGIETSDVIAAS
jgi:hypothetical protein